MKVVMRVGKIHRQAVLGIQRENNRTAADEGSFPLSDIDWTRTKYNTWLVKCEVWQEGIQRALEEHGISSCRKDAVLLIQAVYSASPAFFDSVSAEVWQDYFRRCLIFHQDQYGHAINAVIHLDEKTPHLHVVSVPLVRHGDGWRLCAKDLLSDRDAFRQRLTLFHLEVGRDFGLERGDSCDPAVRKGHIEAWAYRVESLQEKADALKDEICNLESQRDRVAADLGDKVTVQRLAEWAEAIRERICVLFSGLRDWLETLLGKIEARVTLIRGDLEKASCRMEAYQEGRFHYPATKDGDPLTWDGFSPLYIEDGLRYIPARYYLKDDSVEYVEPDTFSRENRDPVAADFMDRLEDVSDQLADLTEALENVEADPVDRDEGSLL